MGTGARVERNTHEAQRTSYQVALSRCAQCGQESIDAGGRSHPVDQAVTDMAACDSQDLGAVGGAGGDGGDSSSSPHTGADDEGREAGAPWNEAWCPEVLRRSDRAGRSWRAAYAHGARPPPIRTAPRSQRGDWSSTSPRARGGSRGPWPLALPQPCSSSGSTLAFP
jgi:hypothetical protein